MKIRLIEPEPPGMNVFSKVMFPRLGLPAIGAALTSQGHDVCIYVPQFSAIDWNDVYTSDLVGISTTTSTATAGYQFADRIRARGIPVVMGGPHVTFMAAEALEHADYVARGEGGEAFMTELIEALSGQRDLVQHRRSLFHARRGAPCTTPTARGAKTSTRCPSQT